MHHHMGMRYKKVKATSWQANSNRSLILRQQFAKSFLNQDLHKKNIINIDETWLGMSDFRRMKWTFLGRPNSVAKKQMQPRVSMITALDTRGSIYISLLQANSNSNVMEMFYSEFLKILDKKQKNWRVCTIILQDGAPYLGSTKMLDFYEVNQVPVMFTAPHCYDGSPIELFFAAFKSNDINPNRLPLGKR